MSKERYVSYAIAKLLKEKEFDWKCNHYYMENVSGDEHYLIPGSIMFNENYNERIKLNELGVNINTSSGKISAPTQQMAMRWLREEKMIFISPFPTFKSSSTFRSILHYSWSVDIKNCFGEELGGHYEYITYEDAVEAALEYCLKNII